ncbi:MAG: hypothetical protein ABIJ96_05310 [Elusimicrobiota bacterium]
MLRCLGIFREVTNSPNRESDDALILQAVLEQLAPMGFKTRAVTPEEADGLDLRGWDLIIPMCESYPRIMRLLRESEGSTALWANPPRAVLNCYRTHLAPAMQALGEVRFPDTEVRTVEAGAGDPPAFPAPQGWWLKRGDVHNTCDHDVVRAETWERAREIVSDFQKREITHWIIQPHIDGDLIKFYGAGPGHWFTWFYHDAVRACRHVFDVDSLATQAAAGATALALQIFGGDAIIAPDGTITVLDFNSWPSFALVRKEAAVQISWQLQKRLKHALALPKTKRTT